VPLVEKGRPYPKKPVEERCIARTDRLLIVHSCLVQSISKITISKESVDSGAKDVCVPVERVLNSEKAIGKKSSVAACRSMFARRDRPVWSSAVPLNREWNQTARLNIPSLLQSSA